jgi:hypothetical protein
MRKDDYIIAAHVSGGEKGKAHRRYINKVSRVNTTLIYATMKDIYEDRTKTGSDS